MWFYKRLNIKVQRMILNVLGNIYSLLLAVPSVSYVRGRPVRGENTFLTYVEMFLKNALLRICE